MVRKTGFRIQDSGLRVLRSGARMRRSSFALALLGIFVCSSLVPLAADHSSLSFAQQPQAQQGQPLSALNAKYVNGVAPGYWPTAAGGLTLNLSAGTALCGNPPAPVTYAGGTLTLTAAATNYVYLDPLLSCAPSLNTSGFAVGQIPIAVVVTNASTITGVNDVRTFFSPPTTMDSTGRSIFKGLNGAYFADQLGDKSTTGIASAISACGTSTPCQVVVPGSYPTTEQVPGNNWFLSATTSSNVQVQDLRYGDWETAFNQQGQGNARPWHQWVDNIYTPAAVGTSQTHTTFAPIMNVLDGGHAFTGGGYYAKDGSTAIYSIINQYTPGYPGNMFVTNHYSTGDSQALYLSTYFYGGNATQGDEGAEGLDVWLYQGNTAYQSTIASGGSTGSTSLTMNTPTAGAGTQGANRYLIDTTSGKTISAETISAITCNPGVSPCVFTGNGTSWPTSTVNTTSTAAVTAPGSQTVTLASTSGITTSTVLVFADASAYETVIPSAVGAGSITANFYAPHNSGAIVCAGGLAGYFVELTADTVPAATTGGTALREAFPVLCSSSSTSMTVYVDEQGTYQGLGSASSTQWANTSGQNGYVLYPGAQVLSVFSGGAVGNTFTLLPNAVAWANGDTVELPQHPANGSQLGSWDLQSWWPLGGQWGPNLNFFGIQGPGTEAMRISNNTPVSVYSSGLLNPPAALFSIHGPWASLMDIRSPAPGVHGMDFNPPAWGTQTVLPFVVWPASGSPDYLKYNADNSWTLYANKEGISYSWDGTGFSGPIKSSGLPTAQKQRTCIIDNDTQSATALTAAQFSGRCQVSAASTIVEIDVVGGTGTLTGTPAAPAVTGTGSVQIGKYTPSTGSSTAGLMSAELATASGQACALPTAGTAACPIMGIQQAGSSLSITTTALAAGDFLYVSAATPDAAQTWYTVTITMTVN